MNRSRFVVTFCLTGAAILIGGCSLRQPAPIKQSFLIEAARTEATRTPAGQSTLVVRPLQVAAPFDARGFVYRQGDLNYQPDFYHEFLVPPRAFLTEQVVQWLNGSGLFALATTSGRTEAPYALGGNVSALYGDFRQKDSAKAVLAIQFVLTDERTRRSTLIWHRNYREEVTLTQPSPEALAGGWSTALTKILAALEKDLSNGLPQP